MSLAKCNSFLKETKNVSVLFQQVPVEPGGFVILIPWVVVAALRIHELVAGREHRSSVRNHQDCKEVLYLPLPQLHHFCRYIPISFPSTVPARIAVGPVA